MRLRRWFLEDDERLVRIKGLMPMVDRYGVAWPTMLIDRRGGGRQTVTPIWNWARLRAPWLKQAS